MNLGINKAKTNLLKQKKIYYIVITVMLIGLLAGILFWFLISKENKLLVTKQLTGFFTAIKNKDKLDYLGFFLNSITTNFIYVIFIWLLGISIIGLPIILILIISKCFIIGFSISSIIGIYKLKGILGVITYVFPHQILFLLLLLLLGFYSLSFCIKLFKYLFLKQIINFKETMKKYVRILLISIIFIFIISLYETFISVYLIRLFTSLI